jgi:Zn-dependent protease with chaperone function
MTEPVAARFFDGQTARVHPVTVGLAAAGLDIALPETASRFWRYRDLRRVPGAAGDGELRVGCLAEPDATLVFADQQLLRYLRGAASEFEGRSRVTRREAWMITLWLAAGAAGVAAAFFGIPLAAERVAPFVPQVWQEALGDKVRPAVIEALKARGGSGRVCAQHSDLPPLGALVARLANAGGLSPLPRVSIIDLDLPNAFALPGTQVMVTSGLLRFMEGPNELAAVLAHEFGHVKHRDPVASLVSYLGWDAVTSALFGTGLAATLGRSVVLAANSRSVEIRADAFAVTTLRVAGLDATGGAAFMQRLATRETVELGYLSSHPDSSQRAEMMARLAVPGAAAMDGAGWKQVKGACGERP